MAGKISNVYTANNLKCVYSKKFKCVTVSN